jgi:hypothetical protein
MGGNRIALRNANSIDEMVRQRSPLFQQRAATAGMVQPGTPAAAEGVRDAATLALMNQTTKPSGRLYVGPNRDASDWE